MLHAFDHINGIRKNKLLERESVYVININDDIEKHIKNCTKCLMFWQIQPKDKIIHQGIPAKPWGTVGADMYTLNNEHYHCIEIIIANFL